MPSYLDLGLIAVILVSALLAMLRGFTREVLAIASWVAAAAAGAYLYPFLLPYVRDNLHFSKEPWASIAAATAIFFVALIVVSLITIRISDAILDSKVGALDRSLGFLFGAARGYILCVIAFVFYSMLSPVDKQYDWVRNSRLRPSLESVGEDLKSMLPHDLLNKIMKAKAPAGEPPPETDTGPGEKPDIDQNSPAPLPPKRDERGKEP